MSFLDLSKVEWIQVVSAIGTAVAAVAAWRSASVAKKTSETTKDQLNEMKQQRISQFKPDIIISGGSLRLRFNEKTGYGTFINNNSLPKIKVTNAGLGNARKVKYKWIIDTKKHIDYIKTFDVGRNSIHKYDVGSTFNTENGITFLNEDLKDYHPILLKDKSYELRLPFSYLEILAFYYHLHLAEKTDLRQIPNINVKIMYKDIYNQPYESNYKILSKKSNQTFSESDGEIKDYSIDLFLGVDEV
jgi:hypothetical protein